MIYIDLLVQKCSILVNVAVWIKYVSLCATAQLTKITTARARETSVESNILIPINLNYSLSLKCKFHSNAHLCHRLLSWWNWIFFENEFRNILEQVQNLTELLLKYIGTVPHYCLSGVVSEQHLRETEQQQCPNRTFKNAATNTNSCPAEPGKIGLLSRKDK